LYKEKTFILGRVSLFIDAGLMALAFWMGYFLWWYLHRLDIDLVIFEYRVLPLYKHLINVSFTQSTYLLFLIVLLFPLIYDFNGLYRAQGFRPRREIAAIIAKSIILGLLIVSFLMVITKYAPVSRPLLLGFGVFAFCLTYIKEMFILEYIELSRKSGKHFRYVIIVGIGEIARKAITLVQENPKWGFKIVGSLVPPHMKGTEDLNGYPVLGIYDDMAQILKTEQPDLVMFAVDKRYIAEAEVAIYACETQGVETWMIPDYFNIKIAKIDFDEFFHLPVMLFRTTPEFSWQMLLKGVFDRVFGLAVFILSLPVFIIVPILVKATSRGPVFFSQERCGLRGKKFTVHKFRTMIEDADAQKEDLEKYNEQDGVTFKIENDPRMTKLGKWLRKLSLDEFPQLINVITGSMSIIGPRPLVPEEVDRFKIWQRRRLSMKPGLTCIWVIRGRKNVKFEDWMKLDLEYIDNWSLWLDIKIFFKTIPVILFGKNV
jgi:exopolysaccharide biosynthesis polyprenyl glycosylphosphotransferase